MELVLPLIEIKESVIEFPDAGLERPTMKLGRASQPRHETQKGASRQVVHLDTGQPSG
jgi:hypothetical protein